MIETAGELMFEIRKLLNNFASYYIPIFIDGKKVKDVSLENNNGEYFISIKTKMNSINNFNKVEEEQSNIN